MRPLPSRQRGVAVITALLLTTLAITIVASLFWQQQVQVRSIENQRLQLQKQWILRGALDWTRLILREDARYSKVDHLGEPWAVNLAETRLDQYVENARADSDIPDAAISGSIVDAQSRFNLTNLGTNGTVNQSEVAAFGRLLTNLQLSPALARTAAETMAATQARAVPQSSGTVPKGSITSSDPVPTTPQATATGSQTSSSPQSLKFAYVDDLLAVPGFTPEIMAKLKDFVVVLPGTTAINVNTAPAEVLAARIDTLSLSDAATLVTSRERAWFNSPTDFAQRLPGRTLPATAGNIAVTTDFFLVNGNVRLNRAAMQMQALIKRTGQGNNWTTQVVWIREN